MCLSNNDQSLGVEENTKRMMASWESKRRREGLKKRVQKKFCLFIFLFLSDSVDADQRANLRAIE